MKPNLNEEKWYDFLCILKEILENFSPEKPMEADNQSRDVTLSRKMQTAANHPPVPKENHEKKCIRELAAYIESHYDKPLPTLPELSKTLGINRKKLAASFKQSLGTSIYDYHICKKMEAAMHLLKNTNKSIEEISILLGYNSLPSFYGIFKKKFGCPPGKIRKKE